MARDIAAHDSMGHSRNNSLGTGEIKNKRKAARLESGWELRNLIMESH